MRPLSTLFWTAMLMLAALTLPPPITSTGYASGHAASDSLRQEIQSVGMLLTDYALTPSEVVVSSGTVRLRIVNAGLRRHAIVALVAGAEQVSPTILPGDVLEWELAVTTPGRYMLWCNEYRHLEKGMAGTIVVE